LRYEHRRKNTFWRHRRRGAHNGGLRSSQRIYAHELARLGPEKDRYLIAALVQHGTHVLNEEGDYLAFIPGYPRITVLYDEFLIAYQQEGPTPRVSVYDLHGRFLASGELWDAITEAMEKA
jgi:hypothetical protein